MSQMAPEGWLGTRSVQHIAGSEYVNIPSEARDRLDLEAEDEVDVCLRDGEVIIIPK